MNNQITLPPIASDANKYTRGSLLVLAGSRRYFGAGVLATLAAEKTGAGYVSLATPLSAAPAARQHLLCSPVIEGPEADSTGCFGSQAFSAIIGELRPVDAVCCGPGLTVTEETVAFVASVLRYAALHALPLLLDADALTILGTKADAIHDQLMQRKTMNSTDAVPSPCILTPHAGELARLVGSSVRLATSDAIRQAAQEFAQTYKVILVAKGPTTFITDGTVCYESSVATPALAKAGTGDVLAGVISSLLAQGMYALDAALLGVRIHSAAGLLAEQRQGRRSVTARDVIEALPDALEPFEPH